MRISDWSSDVCSSDLTYPDSEFPEPLSWLVEQERRGAFEDAGSHFESRYFLTLVFLLPPEARARAGRLLYEATGPRGVDWRDPREAFVTETERLLALPGGVLPELVWTAIGRAQVRNPVTNATFDSRLQLAKTKQTNHE